LLHITNGDHAAAVISQVVQGPILPWRDVLHEGPVRAGLSLEELSRERARFIADAGWAPFPEVLNSFEERDAAFRQAGKHDEIVLWFEHDLYDQLQLIQVLDGLAALRGPVISLVCEAEYLGPMAPERAAELFALRNPLVRRHFQEAQAAWAAFRASDPRGIEALTTSAFPFLGPALRRHLEEFPWTTDGLSRTERQILQGRTEEDPVFMGDTVLEWHRRRLESGHTRPRWLGGYEVKDDSLRWDPDLGRLAG
jgi:hypothetical protein